jgi:hypothetical protein
MAISIGKMVREPCCPGSFMAFSWLSGKLPSYSFMMNTHCSGGFLSKQLRSQAISLCFSDILLLMWIRGFTSPFVGKGVHPV